MKRRKIRDERDARACLNAAKASGLELRTWARTNGVDGRSLRAWHINVSRMKRRPLTRSKQLVELVAAHQTGSSKYLVHVGALSLELGEDFDDHTLGRIVGVLRAC